MVKPAFWVGSAVAFFSWKENAFVLSILGFYLKKAYNHRIISESAHSAYDKAAQYFNIKVRRVPVNKDFLADVKGIKRCINRNTIMVCSNLFYCWYLYDISFLSLDCCRPVTVNLHLTFYILPDYWFCTWISPWPHWSNRSMLSFILIILFFKIRIVKACVGYWKLESVWFQTSSGMV